MNWRPLRTATLAGLVVAFAMAAACQSTKVDDDAGSGRLPLCRDASDDLGTVIVYPRTSWRPDQKEPQVRAAIAMRAIETAFSGLPCGQVATIYPMDEPRDWHEAEIRRLSREAGAQTLILLQVRELGPHVVISLPELWSGSTEVRVHVRAIDLREGRPLLDIERRRTVGGAYVIKSADDLEPEMVAVLQDLIGR